LAGADSIKNLINASDKLKFYPPEISTEKFVSSIDCLICRSSPKKPKNFLPSISLAIKYGVPIITNSRNSLADHLRAYANAYVSDNNSQTIQIIKALSRKFNTNNQGGEA